MLSVIVILQAGLLVAVPVIVIITEAVDVTRDMTLVVIHAMVNIQVIILNVQIGVGIVMVVTAVKINI